MQKELILQITGQVQGVGYRIHTQKVATQLDLTGFAKNNFDGSVTVHAQGKEQNLFKLLEWCKNGPKDSKVEQVEVKWEKLSEKSFKTFEIY